MWISNCTNQLLVAFCICLLLQDLTLRMQWVTWLNFVLSQQSNTVKRIFYYLRGTQKYGLLYSRNNTEYVGFSDADWGGDLDDRKSTSGYMFKLGGAAVSWRSKKQACVALSNAEAEYIALTSAAQESLWLHQLLADLQKTELAQLLQSLFCET